MDLETFIIPMGRLFIQVIERMTNSMGKGLCIMISSDSIRILLIKILISWRMVESNMRVNF